MSDIATKLEKVMTTKEALSGIIEENLGSVPLKFSEYPTALQTVINSTATVTPLLSHLWSDHVLNDMNWLMASSSWNSGITYQNVYSHLSTDIQSVSLTSEVVSSNDGTTTWTVNYYLAEDGHKICPSAEETKVDEIFSANGVAWYYIIDTVNQRFRLPRETYNEYNVIDKNTPKLYFFVGRFSKSAIQQTAGITSEVLNLKADKSSYETWTFTLTSGQTITKKILVV